MYTKEQLKKQQQSIENMQGDLKKVNNAISSTIDKLDTIDEKLDILINRTDDDIDVAINTLLFGVSQIGPPAVIDKFVSLFLECFENFLV